MIQYCSDPGYTSVGHWHTISILNACQEVKTETPKPPKVTQKKTSQNLDFAKRLNYSGFQIQLWRNMTYRKGERGEEKISNFWGMDFSLMVAA